MKAIRKPPKQETAVSTPQSETELRQQSLLEHLRDLRRVLIVSACTLTVAFLIIFFAFAEPLVKLLISYITDRGLEVVYTAMTETFSVQLKASFIAAFVAAAPVILWQIWGFIVPALYQKERRIFSTIYLIAIALFALGVVFAYFIVFNSAVNFFVMTGTNLAVPMISINSYVSFMMSFVLPFGIIFEMPLVVVVLVRTGLVKVETLTKIRKYVIFIAFIIAGVLTPTPDIINQLMMGVPLVILYEAGILFARLVERGKQKKKEAEARD